jgi:hypothetical protein
MTQFRVNILSIDVHEYNTEGEGKHVATHQGYTLGYYDTLEAAQEGVQEYFGRGLSEDAFSDEFTWATIVENELGYEDPEGGYLADYCMVIDKIERVTFEDKAA